MLISLIELTVWLSVGLLAGSMAGMILTRTKRGYGKTGNLLVGLAGAVIGGFIFNLLGIDLGLADIAVSVEDLVSALTGAVLLIVVYRYVNKKRQEQSGSSDSR